MNQFHYTLCVTIPGITATLKKRTSLWKLKEIEKSMTRI